MNFDELNQAEKYNRIRNGEG